MALRKGQLMEITKSIPCMQHTHLVEAMGSLEVRKQLTGMTFTAYFTMLPLCSSAIRSCTSTQRRRFGGTRVVKPLRRTPKHNSVQSSTTNTWSCICGSLLLIRTFLPFAELVTRSAYFQEHNSRRLTYGSQLSDSETASRSV